MNFNANKLHNHDYRRQSLAPVEGYVRWNSEFRTLVGTPGAPMGYGWENEVITKGVVSYNRHVSTRAPSGGMDLLISFSHRVEREEVHHVDVDGAYSGSDR